MEIRLQMPSSPPLDFNFHSDRASLCSVSPPTPKPFLFLSAPTSPSRSSELHRELDEFSLNEQSSLVDDDGYDFAFHVGTGFQTPSATAEELFESGRIRSLNTPTIIESKFIAASPPRSPPPLMSGEKKGFWSQITSRKKKQSDTEKTEQVRGRSRTSSAPGSRGARSLSPIRVSKYPWEEEKKAPESIAPSSSTALTLSTNSKSGSKRWRLRDLLLFRSASEGRAADSRDPLRKMTEFYNRQQEVKSSSFGSVSGRGKASAHERHYTLKKAVSEDMKKKTFLPYKQGILGSFYGFGG